MSREELPPIRAVTRADIDLAVDPDHIEDRDQAFFWRQSHAALELALAVYQTTSKPRPKRQALTERSCSERSRLRSG